MTIDDLRAKVQSRALEIIDIAEDADCLNSELPGKYRVSNRGAGNHSLLYEEKPGEFVQLGGRVSVTGGFRVRTLPYCEGVAERRAAKFIADIEEGLILKIAAFAAQYKGKA